MSSREEEITRRLVGQIFAVLPRRRLVEHSSIALRFECVSGGRAATASDKARDGRVHCYGCGAYVDVEIETANNANYNPRRGI